MLSAIGENGPAHGGACSAAAAFSVERMEARDRFISALAEAVSTVYYAEGELYLSIENINAIAEAERVPDPEARAVLDLLDERGLLQRQEGGWAYGDGIGLLLRYEQAHRHLLWQRTCCAGRSSDSPPSRTTRARSLPGA